MILYKFSEQTLQPGPEVSLKCIAKGNPPPRISWLLDGFPIPQNERQDIFIHSVYSERVINILWVTFLPHSDFKARGEIRWWGKHGMKGELLGGKWGIKCFNLATFFYKTTWNSLPRKYFHLSGGRKLKLHKKYLNFWPLISGGKNIFLRQKKVSFTFIRTVKEILQCLKRYFFIPKNKGISKTQNMRCHTYKKFEVCCKFLLVLALTFSVKLTFSKKPKFAKIQVVLV